MKSIVRYIVIIDLIYRKEVRLGDHNITSTRDDITSEVRQIKDAIIHPKYKFPFAYYDVAVVVMDSTVVFTNFIRPICLPETHAKIDNRKNNHVLLTGWGKDTLYSVYIDGGLRRVALRIFEQRL